MRRDRFYRGKSRNDRGRDGGGRSYGGGGGRRRRGGRGRGSFPRAGAESGNQRERIAVESGFLVLIDQFMLANPQFIEALAAIVDADPCEKDTLIQKYGGSVIEVEPGTYRIERDPYAFSIIIHPEGVQPVVQGLSEQAKDSGKRVFVDTRCLAMIDRELLDDSALLDKYQQLWFSGQDKACRDLLRDNGGAVRYGFQRNGDDLGVYFVPEDQIVCLWPEVIPGRENQEVPTEAELASAAE